MVGHAYNEPPIYVMHLPKSGTSLAVPPYCTGSPQLKGHRHTRSVSSFSPLHSAYCYLSSALPPPPNTSEIVTAKGHQWPQIGKSEGSFPVLALAPFWLWHRQPRLSLFLLCCSSLVSLDPLATYFQPPLSLLSLRVNCNWKFSPCASSLTL